MTLKKDVDDIKIPKTSSKEKIDSLIIPNKTLKDDIINEENNNVIIK
jgi:hypothetical protein